jgi:WD domain, G-beta repeat
MNGSTMDAMHLLLLTLFAQWAGPPAPASILSALPAKDVRTVAVATDGAVVAAATSERVVLQWELLARKERPAIHLTSPIWEIAFAPNGARLATLSNLLEIWDPRTGQHVGAPPDMTGAQLAFAIDGTLVVGGHRLTLLPPGAAKLGPELPEQGGWLNTCIACSPDGKLVAAGDIAGNIWVFDAVARVQRLRRHGHVNRVTGVGFIDNGQILVSGGSDGRMKFWDIKTGREVGAMFPHESAGLGRGIGALVCSFDGMTIATGGAGDGTVKLWEAASGKLRATMTMPGANVTSLSIALGGSTLAAGGKRGGAGILAAWQLYASGARLASPVRPSLWQELAGDAAVAYQAILAIGSHPRQAVPLLKQRLRPVELNAGVRKECDGLIAALDHESFEARDEATRKLEAMSPWVEAHLKSALANAKTLELQRRLQALIAQVGQSTLPLLRAVEALEHAPGPEARLLLQQLAAGEPQARITREARQSLQRLECLDALKR